MIRTILGDVAFIEGPMLGHEHLQINLSHNKGEDNVLGVDEEPSIIDDIRYTVEQYGLQAIADLSVPGGGRDTDALARIARQTGVNVICSTGFYWDPLPQTVADKSLEALRDIMVCEIETGIEGTNLRCGTIKIGTDDAGATPDVETLFQAAAAAARATGASIITHTSKPEQATWQLDTLEAAGMDLSHVLISHMHKAKTFEEILAVGKRGAFVGFDQLGFKKGPSIDQVADLAVRLIENGLGSQLIISADIARKSRLRSNGGVGYATTFSEFLPLLRKRDVSESQIGILMSDNPRKIFSLRKDLVSARR